MRPTRTILFALFALSMFAAASIDHDASFVRHDEKPIGHDEAPPARATQLHAPAPAIIPVRVTMSRGRHVAAFSIRVR